jgi:uncharacterized protein YnzC (UPF0291/DUF896 family)
MIRHDEVVGLRLELARVKDQRDAFQAALRKEVLEIVHQTIGMHLETIRPRDPHHGGKIYPNMIEATYVVSPQNADRIKAKLEGGAS